MLSQISALFKRFCTHEPVFAIIDVRPGVTGLPTTAYEAVEQVEAEGKEIQRVFQHLSCSIEADEAEEVSVATCEWRSLSVFLLPRPAMLRVKTHRFSRSHLRM